MEIPSPEGMAEVIAIVAGAGTSGAVSGAVKGVMPQIAPDIAGAGVGLLLFLFGGRIHPLVKAYGVGVIAGSLKGMIEKAMPTIGAPAAPPPTKGARSPVPPAYTAAREYLAARGS